MGIFQYIKGISRGARFFTPPSTFSVFGQKSSKSWTFSMEIKQKSVNQEVKAFKQNSCSPLHFPVHLQCLPPPLSDPLKSSTHYDCGQRQQIICNNMIVICKWEYLQ
jgi:hypothetical protein